MFNTLPSLENTIQKWDCGSILCDVSIVQILQFYKDVNNEQETENIAFLIMQFETIHKQLYQTIFTFVFHWAPCGQFNRSMYRL